MTPRGPAQRPRASHANKILAGSRGGDRITLEDLARKLDLAPATVSRVLNGQGPRYRIAPTTVQRVLDLARTLGYRPNPIARALRTHTSHSIGLVVPDIGNPFFAEIASSVAEVARKNGYVLLLGDSQDSTDLERETLCTMAERNVDGLVVCPVGLESEHLCALARTGRPLVLADRGVAPNQLPCVTADHAQGGRLAAQLLARLGHRRVGIIQGLPGTLPNEERRQAFESAWKQLVGQPVAVAGHAFSYESGVEAAEDLLRRFPDLTAWFILCNVSARGAIEVLRRHGRNIPSDVSLIVFDDHPFSELLQPAWTVIQQPVRDIGRRAAERVIEHLRGHSPSAPVWERLSVRLVLRDSVAARDGPHNPTHTPAAKEGSWNRPFSRISRKQGRRTRRW